MDAHGPVAVATRGTWVRRCVAVATVALVVVVPACSSDASDDASAQNTSEERSSSSSTSSDDDGTTTTADDGGDAGDDLPAGWIEYEAPSGFELAHPEGWTDSDNEQAAVVLFIDPPTEAFRRNINVLIQPEAGSMSLAEYVDLTDRQLAEIDPTDLSSGPTTLADEPAHEWRYVASFEGTEAQIWTVVTLDDGKAWVVTYTAPQASYDEALPDVERVFASFDLP